jgi:hypothetical protein
MASPPISLSRVTLEEQDATVLFHQKYTPCASLRYLIKIGRTDDYGAGRSSSKS